MFFYPIALTDAVLPVVVLAWLLAIHSWLTDGRYGWAASLLRPMPTPRTAAA